MNGEKRRPGQETALANTSPVASVPPAVDSTTDGALFGVERGYCEVRFVVPGEARESRDAAVAAVDADAFALERADIEMAIREAGTWRSTFSANDVRPLLPPGTRTSLIGATFLRLAKAGLIAREGWVISNDRATHAKPIALWRWVGGAR